MMKKIFAIIILINSWAFSSPYIGIGISFTNRKFSTIFSSKDVIQNTPYSISKGKQWHKNGYPIHAFLGYEFKQIYNFVPFIEVGYTYAQYKTQQKNISVYEDLLNIGHYLKLENIQLYGKHKFSTLLGLQFKNSQSVSTLFGIGLTLEEIKAKAWHKSFRLKTVHPSNIKTNSIYLPSIEPTIGIKYSLSEKSAIRFTVGYSLSNRKRAIENYIGEKKLSTKGIKSGVFVKNNNFNAQLSFIYSIQT